jgi:6-phosphogluconolactonase
MKTKFLLLMIGAVVFSAVCTTGAATAPTQTDRVYVLSNKPENSVLVFNRASDGSLSFLQEAATQGAGTGATGDPLQSQGSLALSADGMILLAVNPASSELTAFRVTDAGLEFRQQGGFGRIFPCQRDHLQSPSLCG